MNHTSMSAGEYKVLSHMILILRIFYNNTFVELELNKIGYQLVLCVDYLTTE